MEEDGTIKCNSLSWNWTTKINLAEDCHSSNIRLCQSSSRNMLILQSINKIQPFQELALWFSHDLLTSLQIPFLTPANIQGEKQYVCHRCGYQYEMPNPLKIHLALNCNGYPTKELWNRLKTLNNNFAGINVSKLSTQNPIHNANFAFQLTLQDDEKNIFYQNKLEYTFALTNNNNNTDSMINDTKKENDDALAITNSASKTKSAFKPYVKYNETCNEINNKSEICPLSTRSKTFISKEVLPHSTICSLVPSINCSKISNEENFLNKQAAEMETIMSNLGRIKNGHLCIYCGKMYSRKYGLKIHIRTHTGFKPLKCKYCMRPFGDPSNLNKHVRLHSEANTPYKCDQCEKILVRKRDLDRHIKSRHQCEEFSKT